MGSARNGEHPSPTLVACPHHPPVPQVEAAPKQVVLAGLSGPKAPYMGTYSLAPRKVNGAALFMKPLDNEGRTSCTVPARAGRKGSGW